MELVFVHRFFGKHFSGVNKKIYAQVRNLSDLGLPSKIILICDTIHPAISDKYTEIVQISTLKPSSFILSKIWREYTINTILREKIKSLKTGDILYMRSPYPSFVLSRILKAPRSGKIVIECQTIEPVEYRLKGKYWYILIDLLFGDALRRYSDAIVGVTDEITQYQVARSGNPEKPHLTLGNGIEGDSIPVRKCPLYRETELHLLCVASVNKWHGLDRLIQGLAEYKGKTSFTLHIAGEGSESLPLQRLARKLGVAEHVVFHGFQSGESLDILFDQSHIAVGSLGLHRIGLKEASTLKSREYCARGIPYLCTHNDPDFPFDFPYCCTFPADESPIDMDQVIAFSSRVCQDTDHPKKMRHYASLKLYWSIKMKILKDFLEDLANEDRKTYEKHRDFKKSTSDVPDH